ncbi:prophage Lp3 protein 8, helicase [Ligilactobacillus hayakitensis DSM 18933 = JCM 14209]|uniref:Prophage Lp3 protein 8, helicase n=1 Tax=Ligilactobacillus hayakitensis DSM 18933 = JCM 14209 TaxID=1423755 RepID=A0A0R1WUZ6_9LACO|nr:virulence-associated E family protein [Ligilactobacillus hayakitensis]KRM18918.1 prophage Lp3 protein 8, helicase [Ligilactobacillus hayakitensis DSM 18933 = JCM 14209]
MNNINFDEIDKEITGMKLTKNLNGTIKKNSIKNIVTLLNLYDETRNKFILNEFTGNIEVTDNIPDLYITKGLITNRVINSLASFLEKQTDVLFKDELIYKALLDITNKHKYDPVKNRIEAVEWDKQERVAKYFIDHLGAENNDYIKQVTVTWFKGMIARIYEQEVKFEVVPILTGKQGIGKSTAISRLMPDYFVDDLGSLGTNKDDLLKLENACIVELAELSALTNTQLEKTKSFISQTKDNYRRPYQSLNEVHYRNCVFIGTTNSTDFLKDKTGNRRFYPIECNKDNITSPIFNVHEEEILQVLAESKVLYEQDKTLYLSPEIMKQAELEQEKYKEEDPLQDLITEYLNMPVPPNWDDLTITSKKEYYNNRKQGITTDDRNKINFVATDELLEIVLGMNEKEKATTGKRSARRIKLIMQSLNWKHCRRGKNKISGYKGTVKDS